MSTLETYSTHRSVSRQTGRTLGSIQAHSTVRIAEIEARAEEDGAQLDAVAWLGQRALQGVAFVSQIEGQLGMAVPLAVTRLQAIGDLTTLALGQVVADSVSQLRRRR